MSVFAVHAQPDTLWSARINTVGNPAIYNAINHSSGDFILVGESNSGFSNTNLLIARLSADGAMIWSRTYGGAGRVIANSCVELPNGNLVLAGCNGNTNILLVAVSAVGDSLWSRTYASVGGTCANDITLLQDGNLAVVGYGLGLDGLHSDLLLLKCDQNLDTIWTRSFGGADVDLGNRVTERLDRTLLIAGSSKRSGARDYDFWLMRTNSDGSLLSSSLLGGNGPDMCYDFMNGDSITYMCGKTAIAGSNAGYIVKTSSQGDSLIVRSYVQGGIEDQLRGTIARNSAGGAICVGWSGSSWNGRQFWVLAINSDGSEEWQWVYGPAGSGFYGILSASNGGYLVYGQINELNTRRGYALRAFVSKLRGFVTDFETGMPVVGAELSIVGTTLSTITNQNGEYTLSVINGTYDLIVSGECISRDTIQGIVVAPDSIVRVDFQVLHPQYACNRTSINAVVQNQELTSIPLQFFNTGNGAMEMGLEAEPVNPEGNWLTVTPDTAFIPAGDSLTVQVRITPDTTNNGLFDFNGSLHVTTNSCPGESVTIPVMVFVLDSKDRSPALPQNYSLSVHPNPFNPNTTITFSASKRVQIKLIVYDVTGRNITELANDFLDPGLHKFTFDAQNLPSGVYLVHVESTLFSSTKKMVLMK